MFVIQERKEEGMHRFFGFLMGLILVCASPAFAGNVDTFGIGSKATALGGAYSAYADDPFAVYYNPAGLTQIDRPMAAAGAMAIDPDLTAKDYTVTNSPYGDLGPTDFSDESPNLYVPHIGFAMPINDKWSVGLAAYAPFGLHLEWDENSAGDLSEYPGAYNSYESWYQRVVATPTLAFKVNDKLSFGAGVSLGQSECGNYYQSEGLTQLASKFAGSNTPVDVKGDLEDDFNYSFNIGVMYKPIDALTLGLTYRSEADTEFEGEMEFEGGHDALNAAVQSGALGFTAPAIEKWEYDISLDDVDHPDQVQFGIRYQPHPRVSLEADLVWTKWSSIDNQTVEIDEALDPGLQALISGKLNSDGDIVYPRDWEDTRQVRVGVEWKATDILTLRGGYFYDPSPIPDDTFDIEWADADKKTYSAGFGLNLGESWVVDGVVQYTLTEMDRHIGGESVNLNHSYNGDVSTSAEGEIWGYGLTVTYIF